METWRQINVLESYDLKKNKQHFTYVKGLWIGHS